MHILTAYRMFLEKKFIGHGINSFRHLCDKEPYSTERFNHTKKSKIFSN